VDWRGDQRPPAPRGEGDGQGDHDEAVAKRELDESVDHARTLVMRRGHTRHYGPDGRVRADTRRLSWLDQENGEQEVLGYGRRQKRDRRPPFTRRDGCRR